VLVNRVYRTPQGVSEFSKGVPSWWGIQGCTSWVLLKNNHNVSHIMFLALAQCVNFSQVLLLNPYLLESVISWITRLFPLVCLLYCTVDQALIIVWSRDLVWSRILSFPFNAAVRDALLGKDWEPLLWLDFSVSQESPNFFFRGPHKLIHNNSRAGYLT